MEPQFVHVGIKTAIEPEKCASEAIEAPFLDSLYTKIVSDIAQCRELTQEQVRAAIDNLDMTKWHCGIRARGRRGVSGRGCLYLESKSDGCNLAAPPTSETDAEDDDVTFVSAKNIVVIYTQMSLARKVQSLWFSRRVSF